MTNILPTAVDWQPIETAPRDGTKVLAYEYCDGIYEARFKHGEWMLEGFVYVDESYICHPTFWAPMPELPKEDWQ